VAHPRHPRGLDVSDELDLGDKLAKIYVNAFVMAIWACCIFETLSQDWRGGKVHLARPVMLSIRTAVLTLVAAGFAIASGCSEADKSPDPSPAILTHPSGLQVTLNGPSDIKLTSLHLTYGVNVENHGPKPIAIAVHPVWLRLEVFTLDGQKAKLDDYNDMDWADTTDRDLVIIKPGEKRIFTAYCPGHPKPGIYILRGVIRPTPGGIPKDFIKAMRDEDAMPLKSECRSPTVTVKVL